MFLIQSCLLLLLPPQHLPEVLQTIWNAGIVHSSLWESPPMQGWTLRPHGTPGTPRPSGMLCQLDIQRDTTISTTDHCCPEWWSVGGSKSHHLCDCEWCSEGSQQRSWQGPCWEGGYCLQRGSCWMWLCTGAHEGWANGKNQKNSPGPSSSEGRGATSPTTRSGASNKCHQPSNNHHQYFLWRDDNNNNNQHTLPPPSKEVRKRECTHTHTHLRATSSSPTSPAKRRGHSPFTNTTTTTYYRGWLAYFRVWWLNIPKVVS